MLREWRIHLWPGLVVALVWLTLVAELAVILVLDDRLEASGYRELAQFRSSGFLFLVPVLSAAGVGSVLIVHQPRQPVGWLFVVLAVLVVASGIAEGYAAYGNVARPGALPLPDVMAAVDDKGFVLWLMVLTLILLCIPSGTIRGKAERTVAVAAIASGTAAFVAGLLGPYDGVLHPEQPIDNRLALTEYEGAVSTVRLIALLALHATLLGSAAMFLVRFWSARGTMRQQLKLMALASVVFPVLVVAAFVAATLDQEAVLAVLGACFVAVLPIAAGLAIERDHLFDIDRLISRGLTYSLLTALLIFSYVTLVVVGGEALSGVGGGSGVAIAIATLTTAAIARPAQRFLQTALDKRFNRREFDALGTIRRFIHEPPPSASIEQALREALHDEQLAVVYWIEDRKQWVKEDGRAALEVDFPDVMVERRGGPVARVSFDESLTDQRLLENVLKEAGAELENARLRAAITLQLREVEESRARIVAAQMEERHRLERNLHDGAQQRLLAVALELRASEVSNDPARQSAAIDQAVGQLQLAVRELRHIANGLHPAALNEGGLAGALQDLASRTPTLIVKEVCPERFPTEVEEAAWFISCEAIANAVKHASASTIRLSATRDNGCLVLSIADDGSGGADPAGRGIKGIADRAEAVGGNLAVNSFPGRGTVVKAELPCGSQ